MIQVRITPAVARDIASREVPDAPFDRIDGAGTYDLTPEEASSLLGDAEWQSDPNGPGEALSFGERRAYAGLAAQLRKLGVELAPAERPAALAAVDRPPAAPRPPAPAPVPVAIETLPLGSRCRYKGTILTVDTDQEDAARRQFVFMLGGQRGLALPFGTEVIPA